MAVLMQPAMSPERRPATLFWFALAFSLALHALAGGILAPFWMRAAPETTPPLLVALQALPAPVTEVVAPPPAAHVHREMHRQPQREALPVLAVQHAPVPSPITVERVEPALPEATVALAPAAPVAVATAPVANPTGRSQTGVPPHFDVAYLVKPQPVYPSMARRLGIEGLVLLRVNVGTTGVPEQVSIAQSSGATALDEEALRAVRESRFEPARRGDTPVAHVVEVPIRFRLKN